MEKKLAKEKAEDDSLSQNLPRDDLAPPLSAVPFAGVLTTPEGINCAVSLCKGIVDVPVGEATHEPFARAFQHGSLVLRRTYAYSARTQPLYDNCQLRAPDGTLLANVERRKMNWYLERNLAGGWG